MPHKFIFKLDDIPEPGGKSIQLVTADGKQEAFIIRYAAEVRVYVNSCPHTGVSLNWADDQFFDYEDKFIQCSLHGALFGPLDGRCVRGPCLGESLQSISFELVGRQVIIYI